ncbi:MULTISPECIES: hypothetical protein [unclassified Streptomyces]|uniref:hypothetical protein n=1 Tax=unclassified Streptomyces TaxID=2593676 RepID=UPI001E4702F2|nr:hypothetical protein [Streptomyces sp. CB02980]MCB8906167.1 hypothetical protein [Streptomyces sp. CB02980]
MPRTALLPRAAVALLLGAAAVACADDAPTERPTPPVRTSAPNPTPTPTPAPGSTSTSTPGPATTTVVPAPPAPAVLTQDDSGRTVTLPLGDTTRLRLSGRWRTATPTVDGTAIVLVPVDFESDPGFRAWDIRAVGPGEAVLRTAGQPGPRSLRITFRVR